MFAVKRRLKLNNQEKAKFSSHAGFSRFVYNYGLSLFWQSIDAGLKASDSKRLGAIKKCFTNVTKKCEGFEMIANRKLSASISDLGFYEFRRQLTYKARRFGCWLDVVDRWFPSSRMCHKCGEKHSGLKLSDRTFVCPSCGHTEDRDLQASKNLANAPDELCSRVGSPRTYTPVNK